MEEVTDSGFLGTTPTLACSRLGDDALIQVCEECVCMYGCVGLCVCVWVCVCMCVEVGCTMCHFQTLIAVLSNMMVCVVRGEGEGWGCSHKRWAKRVILFETRKYMYSN